MGLLTPGVTAIVLVHLAGGDVENNGVLPAGQPDDPSPGLLGEDVGLAMDWFFQAHSPASGSQSYRVFDLNLYCHEVAHGNSLSSLR